MTDSPMIAVALTADELKMLSYQFGINVRVDHLRWHKTAADAGVWVEDKSTCATCAQQLSLLDKLALAEFRLSPPVG